VLVCPFDHGPGKDLYTTDQYAMKNHLKEEHNCLLWAVKGIYWAVDTRDLRNKRQVHCKEDVTDDIKKTASVSTVSAAVGLIAKKPLLPQPLSGEHYSYHAISYHM